MDARGIDTDPGWINRRFRELKREIEALRSERRAAATTIADGGSLLVRGFLRVAGAFDLTGTMSMKSEDNVEMVRMGDMTYGRGFELKRDDGTYALRFQRPFEGSAVQTIGFQDGQGNDIVVEGAFGQGLGRPFLEHPLQPVAAASGTAVTCGPYGWERTTASATFETLFAYDGKVQNAFLDFKFAAMASDATTAGEIQVVDLDSGTPLPGFFSAPFTGEIAAGTTTLTLVDPSPGQVQLPLSPRIPGDYVRLGVQVRVTAGTGSITLAVPQSIGG